MAWALRRLDKTRLPTGNPAAVPGVAVGLVALLDQQQSWQQLPEREWRRSACSVPMVCAVLVCAYTGDGNPLGIQTGVLLAVLFPVLIGYSLRMRRAPSPRGGSQRRAHASLSFSVFLLLFVLIRGASTRTGDLLGEHK